MTDSRFGKGFAHPFTMGSTDAVLVEGSDLVASDLMMTIGINRGELRYDPTKGTRLRELKHKHFPATNAGVSNPQADAIAQRLVGEVVSAEEPRVRLGRIQTEKTSDGKLRILAPYTEQGYDGTTGARTVALEV